MFVGPSAEHLSTGASKAEPLEKFVPRAGALPSGWRSQLLMSDFGVAGVCSPPAAQAHRVPGASLEWGQRLKTLLSGQAETRFESGKGTLTSLSVFSK